MKDNKWGLPTPDFYLPFFATMVSNKIIVGPNA